MVDNRQPACSCTHALSLFCASLIPQPWMLTPKHCPAVRCPCGRQYYSLAAKAAFNSRETVTTDA